MNPILSPYVLIMIAAGVICSCITAYVWSQRRNNSETIPLVLLLLGIAEWIAATVGGMLDQDLAHKMLWAQIEYIGVVSVPLMVLVYVLYHAGAERQIRARRLMGLALIPAATLVLAWTNGSHGLIWARYVPYLENGLAFSEKTYGPGFWIYWVYSYLLLLAATVITIRSMLASAKLFRWQNLLILIGILAPWTGNLLYVIHVNPLRNLDLTPLAFGITGILLAIGMFRWRLFDIKPIAQAAVIAGMADGVIILDALSRIVEVNSAAQAALGLDSQTLVGKLMEQVLAGRLPAGLRFPWTGGKSVAIQIARDGETREYELSGSPFYARQGSFGGRFIFLRDQTDRKRLEAKLMDAERKQAEALLRQSENKYETLFHNMSVGVIYQSGDGKVIDINPAAERILGVGREQIRDLASLHAAIKTIHEDGSDFPPEEHPGMVALKTGQPLQNQMMGVYFPEEKTYHWINIHARPQFKPRENTPYQVFITFDDVTARKWAEEALRESEEKFKYVFENSVVGKSITLPSGEMHANQAFCEMLGYSLEDLKSKKWQEITYPEDITLTQKEVDALLSGQKAMARFNKRYLHRNGSVVWADASTSLRRDEQGKPLYLITTVVDITERKRIEEELRESETRYQLVFENSGTANTIFDTECRVILQNSMSKKLTSTMDALGKTALEVFGPEQGILVTERMKRVLSLGVPEVFETKFSMPAGERWMRSSYLPLTNERQVVVGIQVISQDITDRKQAEEALKITLADLERSNQELEQFAYVASHDLQEPLRMVSSYTQLLAERYAGKLGGDADEFIAYAVDGANRMKRLINDLLAYSRVGTRGKPPENVPADAALDRAMENLRLAIQENGAEIIRDPLPTVFVDDTQLAQVFQNLIGNAIKFRREESPRIRIAAEARGEEWVFSVRDNGIGIDPKYLERVFIIFERLNPRGKYPGTGIGLAICKKIVLRHGGSMWVELESGKGSTFYFSLPKTGGK